MAAFMSSFITYLLIFVVSIIFVVIAVKLGAAWRKSKDAKSASLSAETDTESRKQK